MKSKLKGFTLVELIVVIAIIGVLTGVLVPNITAWLRDSKIKTCNSDAKSVFNTAVTVLQDYQLEGKVSTIASDALDWTLDSEDITNEACVKINSKLSRSFSESSQWCVCAKVENSNNPNTNAITVLSAIYADSESAVYVGRYPLSANHIASDKYSNLKNTLVKITTGTDGITQ